ncbi:MAG: serine hydroxymethyltransferase [Candidatus Altiarchaeales archaeon ex4484_96]|nr:MAG: serine hydroxymethyltransferase [Candidatus Altiarchaeales archaeon ex4484_96]
MFALDDVDPKISGAIRDEIIRERNNLQLIASENHASMAVLEAQGSLFTNKYAEGYPHKRYYGGCEYVDVAEDLAIERARKLFKCEHVNVQPHAGSQANMAVYFSALKPGDRILSMELSHGGHLSHGSPVSFSGQLYDISYYGVSRETEVLDYSEVHAIAKKTNPDLVLCGYSAYPRTVDFKAFREIADEVDAVLMADIAHIAGLIAGGVHPSSIPYADYTTTTTHKTLRGPRGGMIMCKQEHAKALDKAVFPGMQGGPFMHSIAAKAVCFKEALTDEYRMYAKQIVINAKRIAQVLMEEGFKLVSDGTDNHLMLVDLRETGLTGKEAEAALGEAGITLNKNSIPFDEAKPWITSGIRIGTPSVTTRGMGEEEMSEIGFLISRVLKNTGDDKIKHEVRGGVADLCSRFPLYNELDTQQ